MAFCGKCGTQLHENATFCANCGTPTGATVAAPPQQSVATPVAPPAYVPQPMYVPAPPPPTRESFGAIFDMTFKSSAGMSLVKVLFVLAVLLAAAVAIFFIYVSQNERVGDPALILILAPILFLLYVMQTRLVMEVCAAIFRMEKHMAEILQQRR